MLVRPCRCSDRMYCSLASKSVSACDSDTGRLWFPFRWGVFLPLAWTARFLIDCFCLLLLYITIRYNIDTSYGQT